MYIFMWLFYYMHDLSLSVAVPSRSAGDLDSFGKLGVHIISDTMKATPYTMCSGYTIRIASVHRRGKWLSEWTHVYSHKHKHTHRKRGILCNSASHCIAFGFVHVHQCARQGLYDYVPAGQWILTFLLGKFSYTRSQTLCLTTPKNQIVFLFRRFFGIGLSFNDRSIALFGVILDLLYCSQFLHRCTLNFRRKCGNISVNMFAFASLLNTEFK